MIHNLFIYFYSLLLLLFRLFPLLFFRASEFCSMNTFNSFNPEYSLTLSQLEFYKCLLFFIPSICEVISFSHYFINFVKNLILVSLLTHKPNFLITVLHVGALIIKVRNAHPEVFNRLTIWNLGFKSGFEAKIRVKAIPTAPLKPP